MENNKYIIFSAGKSGQSLLKKMGGNCIECFIDNNESIQGNIVLGKYVISLQEYIEKYKNKILIASTRHYEEIVTQMKEYNIDFSRYSHLDERKYNILQPCKLSGEGLEIGASINPILPKRTGFNIKIMDYQCREDLIQRFSEEKNDKFSEEYLRNVIEEVDYIWQPGKRYFEIVGKTHCFDYILSSHMIEHAPSIIEHLQDCSMLLKEDGVYSLAIPNKCATFDYFRKPTTIGDVIDKYHMKSDHNTLGTVVDSHINSVDFDGFQKTVQWRFASGVSRATECYKQGIIGLDMHTTIFTPSSFKLLMLDLYAMGFIDLCVTRLDASPGCEFHVTLEKIQEDFEVTDEARLELLKAIEEELMYACMNRMKLDGTWKS